jgi:hypothetical protein
MALVVKGIQQFRLLLFAPPLSSARLDDEIPARSRNFASSKMSESIASATIRCSA